MAQLPSSKVVEPFGEVNVWHQQDGRSRIRVTILMTPSVEGAQTGLAIDGSASMKATFGAAGAVSSLFSASSPNLVEPVARMLASYLANFDSDGKTSVIYWACGPGGMQTQDLGDFDSDAAKARAFPPPRQFGTGTKLLPAVKFFTETRFPSAPWSIFVFVTDGVIEDLSDVQNYSLQVARQIASGSRQFVKLVLLGVGAEVDEGQMEVLDDMDFGGLKDPQGQAIDLWDHKLASEMQKLEEVFAEVVSTEMILAPSAEIFDDAGRVVEPVGRDSYKDGLPALIEFTIPGTSKSFSLVLPNGVTVVQTVMV